MNDYEMMLDFAKAMAVYGNGEGLAIADERKLLAGKVYCVLSLEICYFCKQDEPCGNEHLDEIEALLDERLEIVCAQLGLEYNC